MDRINGGRLGTLSCDRWRWRARKKLKSRAESTKRHLRLLIASRLHKSPAYTQIAVLSDFRFRASGEREREKKLAPRMAGVSIERFFSRRNKGPAVWGAFVGPAFSGTNSAECARVRNGPVLVCKCGDGGGGIAAAPGFASLTISNEIHIRARNLLPGSDGIAKQGRQRTNRRTAASQRSRNFTRSIVKT